MKRQKRTFRRLALSVVVVIGISVFGYLFRTETHDNPDLGVLRYKYRWGLAHELHGDANRDGKVDFRARYETGSRSFSYHDHPSEYWEDRDFDGIFETHVTMDGDEISRVEHDSDANGFYDYVREGEAARDFYRELAKKEPNKSLLQD